MLDWIFEGIATWVASIMTQLMDAVSGLFLEALGTDMAAMEEYFPFMASAYTIIQYTAWAILFLTVVWQIFRAFGGPLTEAENPLHLLARGSISALLIAYARPIFTITLDIARVPYTALMDSSMDPGDFTFAGIEQALTNGLVTIVSIATVVGLLLLIIMMIALAWNYFKLLLETVERYVLVGVLFYTSPLAYSMSASKSTSRVFQSWCRMVGSQLLLLVLNVWFLRAFNSAVGELAANGGALTNGHGSIFLWVFCALALLKIAQKCDSYLASLGLSVAQTGSSMGMEMLMAARVITGFSKGGNQNAASAFGAAGQGAARTTSAGASGAANGGVLAGFVNRYKPNSFVRDAVVNGGSRMGAGGSVGFVGRAFGGMAARNGATLTADSVSSVANRPARASGTIAGEIADRSLFGYMPHLANGPAARMSYSGTQITGGHISTQATGPNGQRANVDLFNTAQYDRPETPHTLVNAADGSLWYQVASGEGMDTFYAPPAFTGDQSEAAQVAESFPSVPEGTLLRQVDDGTLEASYPDGNNALWYSSAHYQEPDAPHETIQSSNGLDWYAMTPHANTPQFDTGSETEDAPQPLSGTGTDGITVETIPTPASPYNNNGGDTTFTAPLDYAGEIPVEIPVPLPADNDTYKVPAPPPPGNTVGSPSIPLYVGGASEEIPAGTPSGGEMVNSGISDYTISSSNQADGASASGNVAAYNQALFGQFMPGYDRPVISIDSSRAGDGILEVRHEDGSGTAFYDRTMYQQPRDDHRVFEDSSGGQWYAIPGTPAVERRPVYQDGKPVYDGEELKTTTVETVRYKTTPTRFSEPTRRPTQQRKVPKKKT